MRTCLLKPQIFYRCSNLPAEYAGFSIKLRLFNFCRIFYFYSTQSNSSPHLLNLAKHSPPNKAIKFQQQPKNHLNYLSNIILVFKIFKYFFKPNEQYESKESAMRRNETMTQFTKTTEEHIHNLSDTNIIRHDYKLTIAHTSFLQS